MNRDERLPATDPADDAADAIHAEAARWHIVMARPVVDRADALAFAAWLEADPAHRRAHEAVQRLFAEMDAHAESDGIARMRAEAVARRDDARRTDTPDSGALPDTAARRPSGWLPWAVAASLVAAVAAPLLLTQSPVSAPAPGVAHIVQTAPGQRRVVRLADGSRLSLDAATRVIVRYGAATRAFELEHGQARFQVAHGDARPFSVQAGRYSVVATGTDFNVNRTAGRAVVSLLQGSVIVAPRDAATPDATVGTVTLRPGDRLEAADRGGAVLRHAEADDALAWQGGKLAFDAEPLSAAVERLNRVGGRRVTIDAAVDANRRISGVFDERDVAGFAMAVAQLLHLDMAEQRDGTILIRAPRSAADSPPSPAAG